MEIVETPPDECGGSITTLGCASRTDDGGCHLKFAGYHMRVDALRALLILKHEMGHCILNYSGNVSIGYHLPGDKPVMRATLDGFPRASQTVLTTEDRKLSSSAWYRVEPTTE
jgi:hypothetical protein